MVASRISGRKPVEDVFRRERVVRLCRTAPATALKSTTVAESVRRLRGDSGGCVIIVESDEEGSTKPVGIFTERDYLDKLALEPAAAQDVPIEKVMTPNPTTLSQDESLDRALDVMTVGGYRHLPLVDSRGCLCGVLSVRDIISYLAEFFPIEVMNLPPHLDGSFHSREGE